MVQAKAISMPKPAINPNSATPEKSVGTKARNPAAVAKVADAVVVGSALVDEIAAGLEAGEAVAPRVLDTAARLAKAVRAAGAESARA